MAFSIGSALRHVVAASRSRFLNAALFLLVCELAFLVRPTAARHALVLQLLSVACMVCRSCRRHQVCFCLINASAFRSSQRLTCKVSVRSLQTLEAEAAGEIVAVPVPNDYNALKQRILQVCGLNWVLF